MGKFINGVHALRARCYIRGSTFFFFSILSLQQPFKVGGIIIPIFTEEET